MIKTLICSWCNEPFTYEAKKGPERKYCCDEHRELGRKKSDSEYYQRTKDHKEPTVVELVTVTLRSFEEMRSTGPTFDERRLLKERRSAIQIPKERLAARIERAL